MTTKNEQPDTRTGEPVTLPSERATASTTQKAATFTRGPWRWETATPDDPYCSLLFNKRLYAVNGISPGVVFGGIFESEANARLIAAAPDLYEVVRRVAEHFADTDAPLGAAARAALAKADGDTA